MECTERFKALMAQFADDPDFIGTVTLNEPLARRTTMRTGGSAALFLEPADEQSIIRALSVLDEAHEPYFVLAGGSNVIISDKGFDCTVISMRALHQVALESREGNSVVLTAQAGSSWGRVISLCKEKALSGFEGFAGLPGTVGGALYMNASCFGHACCDNLLSVRYYQDGAVHDYVLPPPQDSARQAALSADWGYKRSPFQQKPDALDTAKAPVLLSAGFACTALSEGAGEADCAAVRERYDETLRARTSRGHFTRPSAGSTFKNDSAHGIIAGKLIDECGLKGYTHGGAQVAPWHGNIVINAGGATAADIRAVVEHVQHEVLARTGVMLESEVIFCGNWQ